MNVNEIKTYYQVNGKWEECEILSGEEMVERANELLRENERLNNILNELEKDLKEASNCLVYNELVNGKDLINNILNDLKELKEKNNEKRKK